MTINRTTLLDLPLPVTGTESGVWGDITNNGLSQYLDIAIAGRNALTSANFTAGALTLSLTEGDASATNIAATSAQYGTLFVSSLAANSTITAPSSNRAYRVVNADATYTLTVKASGQTGVTLLPGQTAVVAFNGTDYVFVGMVGAGTVTNEAIARFDGTTGKLVQNSSVTISDAGAVVAPQAGSVIPFYFDNQAAFPSASTYHGAVAHSHADGAMYFAHGGSWVKLLNVGVVSGVTQLDVDNLRLDGNTLSSTNSNGNITLAPNGTGRVQVSGTTSNSGGIELFEDTDNGTNKVLLTVPASIASDVTATIPATTTTLAGLAVAQTFSVSQRGTVTTDNDGSFDMNATNNFLCTPTAGFALTFTNITAGQSGNIILVNGSNYAITAAAATKVASTTLATISATGTYWLSYFSPDGTNVYVANTGALA